MAHPHREDAKDAHNTKMKRMTENYGSASGPKNNIAAPQAKLKQEGPEDAIGFGADSSKPRARADRRARGGLVPAKTGGVIARASGGRAHKGKRHGTHVNVIVAPQGGAGGGPMMPPPGAVRPVAPVGAMPPPGGPPPGAPPPGAGGPPGMPPGAMPPGAGGMAAPRPMLPPGMPPRKRGGRVHRDDGGTISSNKSLSPPPEDKRAGTIADRQRADGGAVSRVGTLKDQGLVAARARGGATGHADHYKGGAESGQGRLDKIAHYGKKAHAKPQVV